MAQVENPRKQFQFNVIIPGLNPFLCQKVKSPDVELEIAEHGDANYLVKTAGIKKVGMMSLEKILSAVSIDNYISNWMSDIQSTRSGGGMLPMFYKRNILIEQYAPDGRTVIATYVMIAAWPQKRNGIEFDRKASDNTIESVEFCCDDLQQL